MKSRFHKNPTIKLGIASIIIAGFLQSFLFAQNIQSCDLVSPYNTNRVIKKETTLYAGNDCNPKQDIAGYAGKNVYLLLGKNPDTFLWRLENNGTYVRVYGSVFDDNLQFPYLSNYLPTSATFSSPILIIRAQGGLFLKPSVDRNTIAGQIVTKNIYRRLIAGSVSCNYYYTNASTYTKIDATLAAKMNTTTETATSCTNYYVAYCGDGILDNSTTEKEGITVNGSLVKWGSGNVPNEACDDGAQNGQAGKCKTDCSGIGNGTSVCGNGIPESGETCDDGAQNGQPGKCNSTCNGIVPVGNFAVTKTIVNEKSSYTPGENIQFKISFTNGSTQTVSNISIQDYLPDGFTYVSSEISGIIAPSYQAITSEGGNTKISYTGFALAANQQGYILVNAKLVSCNKTLNNVFWTGGTQNGYANKLVTCSSTPISISKSVSKSSFAPGETAGFSIQVNNNTTSPISTISLQDIWPSNGCVYFTGTFSSNIPVQGAQNANISTWTLASLGVGQTLTLVFSGQVKADAACAGAYTNTANISYTDPSGTKQNSTTANFSVSQISQSMNIIKTVVQDGGAAGDMVVFKITYTNNGLTPINGFKITDYWPDALDFVSSTTWPVNSTSRPLVFDFSKTTLQPNQGGEIKITGQIKNTIH